MAIDEAVCMLDFFSAQEVKDICSIAIDEAVCTLGSLTVPEIIHFYSTHSSLPLLTSHLRRKWEGRMGIAMDGVVCILSTSLEMGSGL
jgi:hypothetical protein